MFGKKVNKILKLPSVCNCFILAMTNKLVVIINSLKVPKIKKLLLYEMKFCVPNYSRLQNPWLGGRGLPPPDPRSLSSVLNWICWTPCRTKFLGMPLTWNYNAISSPLSVPTASYSFYHFISKVGLGTSMTLESQSKLTTKNVYHYCETSAPAIPKLWLLLLNNISWEGRL